MLKADTNKIWIVLSLCMFSPLLEDPCLTPSFAGPGGIPGAVNPDMGCCPYFLGTWLGLPASSH